MSLAGPNLPLSTRGGHGALAHDAGLSRKAATGTNIAVVPVEDGGLKVEGAGHALQPAPEAPRPSHPKRAKVGDPPPAAPGRTVLQCREWDTDGSFGGVATEVVAAAGYGHLGPRF